MFILASHTVEDSPDSVRLNDYCFEIFQPYIPSRKGIKKAIKRGEILVNENSCTTALWVQKGMRIDLVDLEQNPPKSYPMELEIAYEDNFLAIINKPAGISVSGNQYRTIQNALIGRLKNSKEKDALKWPRPVHRLDNQTSGLLLIAKTATTLIRFGHMFEQNRIQKEYHALVMGSPPEKGSLTTPVDQKEAYTEFERVSTVPSLRNKYTSMLQLRPTTGRTHQLRIHCSQSGFPILGDKLYGPKDNTLLHKGLFLCSNKLKFEHPITGAALKVEIELPQKFYKYLEKEEIRWNKYHKKK